MILGITGGLATGKSSAAGFLVATGVRIVDCDAIAHFLTANEPTVLVAIRSSFGDQCFHACGALNRAALAEIAFSSANFRLKLEEIMHPPISAYVMSNVRWSRLINQHLIVVIPLLFEGGWERQMDQTLVISSSEELQLQRAQARGLTENQARQRISAQWPMHLKEERANAVIRNNGTLDELRSAVHAHWEGCIAV